MIIASIYSKQREHKKKFKKEISYQVETYLFGIIMNKIKFITFEKAKMLI